MRWPKWRPRIIGLGCWMLRLIGALALLSVALVGTLRWVDPPASAFMLRHAWNLWRLDQSPPYYRHQWTPLSAISPNLQLAAIVGEDQRFPTHLGFDLIEIRSAWRDHQRGARLRGASTISQQTAKNLFLWPGSGWGRKLFEAWFTLLIETLWPKSRILEVYLNIVQFSPSDYGATTASRRFFGCDPDALSLEQSALLISVLPAPGNHRIDQPSDYLRWRADWIIGQANQLGDIGYLKNLTHK